MDILLIARIFPRPFGAWKNTTQLAKYPCVLYVKPSNKVYLFLAMISLVSHLLESPIQGSSSSFDNPCDVDAIIVINMWVIFSTTNTKTKPCCALKTIHRNISQPIHQQYYMENNTWAHGDMKFIFECST